MKIDLVACQEWKDGEYIAAPSYLFNDTEAIKRNTDEKNNIPLSDYYWFIFHLTNSSIANETIDNRTVQDISDALTRYVYDRNVQILDPIPSDEETTALYRWFKTCADNGYFLKRAYR